MSSPLPATSFPIFSSNLPEYCTPTNSFLVKFSSTFDTCIPTPLAFLSTCLGIFNVGAWLFALPPQIYKNFAQRSAAGLSVYFLSIWFLGDLTNLLGALFTGQASWQVVVAAYFVSVDVVLGGQYAWYTYIKPWRRRRSNDKTGNHRGDYEDSGDVLEGVSPADSMEASDDGESHTPSSKKDTDDKLAADAKPTSQRQHSRKSHINTARTYYSEKPSSRKITRIRTRAPPSPPARTLLFLASLVALAAASPIPPVTTAASGEAKPLEFAGRILSWTSTILYLGSRMPQIYKNHYRRSTSGLSPVLFAAAFTGNLFYSTSVVTNPLAWASYPPHGLHGWVGSEGSDRSTWVALATPFWLGTAGVLVLDATIGVQFLRFGEGQAENAREGKRGRWHKVSGWMRGWVPSPGPDASSNGEGEQRSLLRGDGGEDRGGRYGGA